MPDDKPLGVLNGRVIYDNAPTVCVVAATGMINGEGGVIAVRRVNDPGAGKIGLPGGFHMRGESWQTGARRELEEETGFTIDERSLVPTGMITDEYGHNLILAVSDQPAVALDDAVLDGEASEVFVLRREHLTPDQWAFPIHLAHAVRAVRLAERGLSLHEGERVMTNPEEVAGYLSLCEAGGPDDDPGL